MATRPTPAGSPLLILGASARAAARSASRAGFAPTGVDLFADLDLADLGPTFKVSPDDYPAGLVRIAGGLPASPWIYTGAIENHPALIDRLAARRPLLGIGGGSLREARDPRAWTRALGDAGIPAPATLVEGDRAHGPGDWLLKPVASASGLGIRVWSGDGPVPPGHLLQRRVRGTSLGATFLGDGRSARLVGTARQFLGLSADGLRVRYRGSVGPWPISGQVRGRIGAIGATLADAFGLRGLFGVDVVVRGRTPWPVEINPRYTASVEVLEEALGVPLLAEHARCFGIEAPTVRLAPDRPGPVGKRIMTARRPGRVPPGWSWGDPEARRPHVADLPAPGTVFGPGDPVLTVFARGDTIAEAVATLRRRAARWRRRIDAWSD